MCSTFFVYFFTFDRYVAMCLFSPFGKFAATGGSYVDLVILFMLFCELTRHNVRVWFNVFTSIFPCNKFVATRVS
ncbi:putative G protein-coupled receptor, rhodopsin [Helianthus annuus]|nr:putative G protein-coupled receptor, rhodopsin [Helianthus annuus]